MTSDRASGEGRLLNLSDFSRETCLPFTTLRRYMNLLDVTYHIFLLRPYFTHTGKRLVKTPKIYVSDTGMASHFIGADDRTILENQGNAGPMIETWIASELIKLLPLIDHRLHMYFWRTRTGHEVDFLIEWSGRLVAIEVKWAKRIEESDIRNLERCAEDLKDKLCFSVVLYGGGEIVPLSQRIVALPFPVFFGIDA